MNAPTLSVAYVLDLALGDPEGWPHPVRWFGALTAWGERRLRPFCSSDTFSSNEAAELCAGGALTAGVVAFGWILGRRKGPLAQAALGWTALATRSLLTEAGAVVRALEAGDLPRARRRIARIVGRDTAHLDESQIARALIETLAESACDGIVAPLFWMAVAGLPGAMAYKAVNTLDSMIGHPEPPYRYFGRVAARLDDAANFIPARLTALAIVAAARVRGFDSSSAWRVWMRDGSRHASPNAGQSEAAIAGALDVRLGGASSYDGKPHQAPTLHAEGRSPSTRDARAAIGLIAAVSGLAFGAALCFVARRGRQ
jgi:adenosylcobinamide-phosphate synthase